MKTLRQIIFAVLGFSLCFPILGQVSLTAPRKWERAVDLGLAFNAAELKLPHNGPELIRQELLDTSIVSAVARHAGITRADLTTVQIAPWPGRKTVAVYQVGKSKKTFDILVERLQAYVRAREEGHTTAYLLAAMTNRVVSSRISDLGLRVLATNQIFVPLSWIKRGESGTSTNKAGRIARSTRTITAVNGKRVTNDTVHIPRVDEVCRWSSYFVVDAEIAWRYFVMFKADGSLHYVSNSRCDAKEYDPNYQKLINDVETEVTAAMKKDGSYGQFGSVHTFWDLKKERLKTRGVEWRSPSELNPHVSYD